MHNLEKFHQNQKGGCNIWGERRKKVLGSKSNWHATPEQTRRTRILFGSSMTEGEKEAVRGRETTDMNFWKGLLRQIAKRSPSVYTKRSRTREEGGGGGD